MEGRYRLALREPLMRYGLGSGMRTTFSDKEAIVWHDNFEPHQTIYQEARRRPLYCIEGFFFFQYF